jgi:NADH:ubiquinone oxidoreductase subunit E
MKEKFLSLIMLHYLNHKSELSVGDTVKSVTGIDRFKAFIDTLYVVFNASPKNSRELEVCTNLLCTELQKIG